MQFHRSDPLWAELEITGVQVIAIRFQGGQHLDYITAYSANDVPVLELCRSDSRRVLTELNANIEQWHLTKPQINTGPEPKAHAKPDPKPYPACTCHPNYSTEPTRFITRVHGRTLLLAANFASPHA